MRHPARWIALAIGVVVVGIGVVLATQVGTDPQSEVTKSQLVGKTAPKLDLRDLSGTRVDATSLAGKAVIVNFWNTWCVPCQAELPVLKDFYSRHAQDADLAFVGVVRDDSQRVVRDYVKAEKMPWIIAMDPESTAALDFGTRGQPETFAIGPNGIIAAAQIGPATERDLETMLAAARGQAS